MSEPDVVENLDYWINVTRRYVGSERTADVVLMQRARDEIVVLRDELSSVNRAVPGWLTEVRSTARAEALEAAAAFAEASLMDGTGSIAAGIRALKDKP
jgi:hypothetical protein